MTKGNIGHGHVFTRPDGHVSRCGGPGFCGDCARDYFRKMNPTTPSDLYTDYVCDQSLSIIRVNECNGALSSLVTQRFRKVFNELSLARDAIQEVAEYLANQGVSSGAPIMNKIGQALFRLNQ